MSCYLIVIFVDAEHALKDATKELPEAKKLTYLEGVSTTKLQRILDGIYDAQDKRDSEAKINVKLEHKSDIAKLRKVLVCSHHGEYIFTHTHTHYQYIS